MSTVTIFTSMTNPDERKDPWKQALNCYEDLADEVNIMAKIFLKNLNGIILEKYFKMHLIIKRRLGF